MSGRHYFAIAAHTVSPVELAHRVTETLRGARGLVMESVALEADATSRPRHLTFAFAAPGHGKAYGMGPHKIGVYADAKTSPAIYYAESIARTLDRECGRILYSVSEGPPVPFAVRLQFSFSGKEEALP